MFAYFLKFVQATNYVGLTQVDLGQVVRIRGSRESPGGCFFKGGCPPSKPQQGRSPASVLHSLVELCDA